MCVCVCICVYSYVNYMKLRFGFMCLFVCPLCLFTVTAHSYFAFIAKKGYH